MAEKYNYTNALKLLKDAYDANINVTYNDLETAFELEGPIGEKDTPTSVKSAIHLLRIRLKKEYGLTFKSAANGTHSGSEYHYYIISKVKEPEITKKKNTEVKVSNDKNNEYEALSKNNQKLYMELEQEKAANAALLEKLIKLEEKEKEYKNIIQSLYRLLNI